MENQSLPKNLVYQRKLKGYTQEVLAEKTTVTVRTIQRIEKGEVNPHLQTVKLLAAALDIEVDELLNLENPKEEAIQKKWLLLLHGTPLLAFGIPLFNILIPLFIWIHKREDNPLYERQGRVVINFQITMTLLFVVSFFALVTVQGYGFFFFISVIPFVVIVILGNIISVLNTQKCYYPFAIPFLRSPKSTTSKVISLFLISLLVGCSFQNENSEYEKLLDYEGKYEYSGNTSLTFVASEIDTTLYAVIDNAKYPLKYVSVDSFTNIQNIPVTFQREKEGRVKSYTIEGDTFSYISSDVEKIEMYPRKELFNNSEAYEYRTPEKNSDGLEVGDLKTVFKNPQPILDMVKETIKGNYQDVHSILIYKDEKLVLEEYFYGYTKDEPHQLRSATKPFFGALVGIAIEKKMIGSEQDKLSPYFNEQYGSIANVDENKEEITIEDFLTYRHGMDCEDNNPKSEGNELKMMESEDWIKHTLDLPMVRPPGEKSSYCTGSALTLGLLTEIASKQKLESFAKENLFTPLGITNYHWRFAPDKSSMTTFSQMKLTSRDLLKLAKMYKDRGKWQNKQILPESWVEKTFDMQEGDYGYLWYHKYFEIDGKRYNSYLASGNGGQKINIWPELNMITVFTGGNYNSYALYGKSTPPNEMIPKYILKAL